MPRSTGPDVPAAAVLTGRRRMRYGTWLAGGVWIGSWYLMYLEITRWHHVKPSLAFNHDIAPGARPGRPLMLLYVASVVAPSVVGFQVIMRVRARRNVRS